MFIGKNVADASAIIAYHNKEIFLQLRSNKSTIFYPKFWGCFGGARKTDETFLSAAFREFNEETSIPIKKKDLIFFFKMKFYSKNKKFNFSRIFYLLKIKDKKEFKKNFVLGEGQSGRFFNFNQYIGLKYIVPYDRFIIDIFFDKLN